MDFRDFDWLALVGPLGMAAVASAMVIVGLGLSLQADMRLRRAYVPVIAVMLGLVPAIGVLLSGRDVTKAIDFTASSETSALLVWFLRLSSATIVGLSLVRIGATLMSRERREPGPAPLLLAFLTYFACNYLLNAVFGSVPAIPTVPSIYVALVLCAVYLSRDVDPVATIRLAKVALMVVMVASLAPFLWNAGLVRQVETAEIRIPGVGFRLFGVGSNPNSIATLALMNLLLSLHQRFGSRLLELANVAVTAAVLVLAQSQTSWLAALIAVPVLLIGRSGAKLLDRRTLVALSVLVMLLAVGVLGLALFAQHGLTLSDFFTGDRYREVTSLTGRSAIWRSAMLEWEDSPLFGHGPTMWDSAYRMRIGMPFAFTAHNQYLQSLAVAGAVGLCGTLVYLTALGGYCFTAPPPWRGLALALYAQILLRTITEVPLDIGTPFANEFYPHFLLFFVLVASRARAVVTAGRKVGRTSAVPAGSPSAAAARS